MAIAFVATAFLLPTTPPDGRRTSLIDPLRALRHRGLLTVAITALLYNFGFFTLLAFTPFPLAMSARQIGLIFFGWGMLLGDHLGVRGARGCSAGSARCRWSCSLAAAVRRRTSR